MGVLLRLDNRGHGEVARWKQGDRRTTAEAEKLFAEHRAKHFTMFDISRNKGNDEPGEVMKAFDESVEEILACPPMKAG